MFRFEHRSHPVLPWPLFLRRVARSGVLGAALIAASLLAGMLGYHELEGLDVTDSFENAAMILSGMGPLWQPQTEAGKVFAGVYALYSGLAVLVIAGIAFAPVIHRFFHLLHAEDEATRECRASQCFRGGAKVAGAMNELSERGGVDPSLVTYTHIIYALHATSVLVGVTGAATVVGSFVFGLPSILAVVMNYARQPEVEGTWLQGHFLWQIRTFWYALLWMTIAGLISFPLILLFGLGILTFFLAALIVGAWVIYRVLRGWIALRGGYEPN